MTTVGTGVGGSTGGPPTETTYESQTKAAALVAKAKAGIVEDAISQAVVLMTEGLRYNSANASFSYNATSSRALLDHPIDSMRVSQNSTGTVQDDSVIAIYNQLVNLLPADILQRFNSENNNPFDQRSANFVATSNLLMMTAKVLNQIDLASSPAAPGSLEELRTAENLTYPFIALNTAIDNGYQLSQATQGFLEAQGANYPYFDVVSGTIGEMNKSLALLQKINGNLGDATENGVFGQLNDQARALAGKAALQLTALNNQLGQNNVGPDLSILEPMINAISITATALALPNTASGSLYIALELATMGISTQDSAAGIMGPSFSLLTNSLISGISNGVIPGNQQAGGALFSLMVQASLIGFVYLAKQAVDSGFGPLPRSDAETTAATQFFGFETALQLATNSGIIQDFYNEVIAASGGNSQTQELGGSVLAQVTNLLMILAAADTAKQQDLRLLENDPSYLEQGIADADAFNDLVEGNGAAAVAIKQSIVALDNQDYEGFKSVMNALLMNLGSSVDLLKTDMTSIGNTVGSIATAVGTSQEDGPQTSIINIV